MEQAYAYYAFISYNHKDAAFARKLQRYLEHYRLPSRLCRQYPHLPKVMRPVFRDESDLALGQLNEGIRQALAASHFLIVLCSENSARADENGWNWVDEEVRVFLDINRERNGTGRVVPIILREKGGASDAACLLPSIREHDILAADLLTKGEERTLSDVVAKMAGLKPDILWDRHQRELRRKRRRQCLGAAGAALLAATAGLWSWSYYVPHYSYYRDYVERNNVPEGLFELTEEQLKSQHRHYRFTSHKHRLRKVEHRNALGELREHEHFWQQERPACMELEYNEAGEVAQSIHRNARGYEFLVRKFAPATVDFLRQIPVAQSDDKRVATLARLISADSEDALPRPPVNRHVVLRGQEGVERGLVAREFFCKENSLSPIRDEQGLGGREFRRDELGRAVEMRYLTLLNPRVTDPRTAPKVGTKGFSGYRLRYGEHGLVESFATVNHADPALAPEGETLEETRFTYDARGNVTEIAHYGAEGQPIVGAEGYARATMVCDERGQVVEMAFLGLDGAPCFNRNGVARLTLLYDERGNVVEEACFGTDGSPCLNNSGYARATMAYDERGNKVEEACFGTDGSPCLNNNAVARITLRYDACGRVVEEACFGTDGSPCCNSAGIARTTRSYDEQGNHKETAFYGEDGKLRRHRMLGYARITRSYDGQGKVTHEGCYAPDGKPCPTRHGYAGVTLQYDELGNPESEYYYGADNTTTTFKGKQEYTQCRHDRNGNIIELSYVNYTDMDFTPCLSHEGAARVQREFDATGRLVRQRFYGIDNAPTLNTDGFFEEVRQHDARGNIIRRSYLDTRGAPCLVSKGFSSALRSYDARGNIIEESYLGTDGKPCLTPAGYARAVTTRDARGNVLQVALFGVDGKPCSAVDGFAVRRYGYDERDREVEISHFGVDGSPCANRKGISILRKTYDERGRIIAEHYFGTDGQPILCSDGHSSIRISYDARGNMAECAIYGPDGKPCERTGRIHRAVPEYDSQGNTTAVRYYDARGRRLN